MPEPVVTIVLDPDQYRRWVIAAGRSGKPVDEWVRGFIDRIIEAEMAGRRTAVEREMIPPPPPPEVRKCAFCGEPLGPRPTARRAYCGDVCRVRAWRRAQQATGGSHLGSV